MARITLSAHITSAAGKIGGTSFHRTRYGANIITKPVRSKKPSTYQVSRRNYIQVMSQSWRSLSQAQRDKWNAHAGSGRFYNMVTHKYILQGFYLYRYQNYWRYFNSQALLTSPIRPGSKRTIGTLSSVLSTTNPRYDLWCAWAEGNVSGSGEVRASFGYNRSRVGQGRETCFMRFGTWTSFANNLYTSQYIARYGRLMPVGTRIKLELYVYDTNLIQVTDYRIFTQTVS